MQWGQDMMIIYLVPHLFVPSLKIVLVPWEAVYQEVVLITLRHGSLYQGAGDLN